MKRLRLKVFLWSVLLISVFLKTVEPSTTPKHRSTKVTKTTPKPLVSTTTTAEARSTTTRVSSRNTVRPKSSSKRTTTTTTTTTPPLAVETTPKPRGSSTSNKKKQQNNGTTTTTTLSPIEVMNRLYQMHGLASHGISASHANYQSHPSSSSSNPKKKQEQQNSNSMDDIYRLHALAIAQAPTSSKKRPESSNSDQKTTDAPKKQKYQGSSIDHIYQQHSSLPSSMHNIMSQHSISSHHSSSKKPHKSSSSSVQESSSTKLSSLMQPLLKQLTPVGAGIGVVLAPLLLFNGFLQFFSNMSRFLNNFAQTMLPNRRPPMGQTPQSQNAYFQNLGPAHLKRQPREWYMDPQNIEKINELAALFVKALKEVEKQ